MTASKWPPGFWVFQLPWMPTIHLSLFLLRPTPHNLLDIMNFSLGSVLPLENWSSLLKWPYFTETGKVGSVKNPKSGFDKKVLDSKHVSRCTSSRKNLDFGFFPLLTLPVSVKNCHLSFKRSYDFKWNPGLTLLDYHGMKEDRPLSANFEILHIRFY